MGKSSVTLRTMLGGRSLQVSRNQEHRHALRSTFVLPLRASYRPLRHSDPLSPSKELRSDDFSTSGEVGGTEHTVTQGALRYSCCISLSRL